MKRLLLLATLALALAGNAEAQTTTLLSGGRNIPVRLTSAVSSDTKHAPAPTAIVDENIMDDAGEYIVIRKGTPVLLDVQRQRTRALGRPGFLKITGMATTSVDGNVINLQGDLQIKGKAKRGLALGAGFGLCWVYGLGLFFFFVHGNEATIAKHTPLTNITTRETARIRTNTSKHDYIQEEKLNEKAR